MRRREFVTLLGGAVAAWPFAAGAQQKGRTRLVGGLLAVPESDPDGRARIAAFEEGLKELGWVSGRNVKLVYRTTGGLPERIQGVAKELVELRPDAILAPNTPSVLALMRETRTIPIIFVGLTDPVETGLVQSLARPGANVTGLAAFQYSLAGKWLEILKEAVPGVKRTALLFDPATAPFAPKYVDALLTAGKLLGVETAPAPVREVGDFEPAIAAEAREPGGSLIVMPSNFINVNRTPIISLTARYNLPAMYPLPAMTKEGGLIFYGASVIDLYRRAASYVDRVLRNEKPGQLPVQQPTKFGLVVNLKTANALGLTVPQTLLAIADEVIE
jgi:putative ABC transport system substrate-binding protein